MTRKGYKHTELGEIPEDWEVKTLGEVCTINPESTGLPNIFYYIDLESVVSGKILNKKLIERDNAPSRAQRLFRQYDVLYQLVRPYQLNNLYIKFDSNKYVASTGYAIIRSNCGLFVYYVVNTYSFMTSVLEKCTGTSYPAITSTELASIPIPLPPLPEQRAIASALSDVDALIEALDRLIDKKRKIKQGTMQQLLSGKKRLKGFGKGKGYKHTELGEIPEDWEVKTLGEIGYFKSGNGFPIIYQGNDNGIYPFYKVSDLNTSQNDCMNISKNYISDEVAEILKVNLIQKGSIVFAKIGAAVYLERKKILTKTSCIDNNMMAFTLYNTCYNKYIYHWMLSFRISTLSNTSALPSISASDLQGVKLPLPPLPEQRAIASVLSDMDAEIEALEAKRNKYAQIKQGMMQNLLTGRVRLPVKEV